MTKQFARFCVVGATATAINYLTFYFVLRGLSFHYLIAGAAGFVFAAVPAFLLNRRWTFRSSVSIFRGLTVYIAINVFTLGCHETTLWIVTEIVGVPEIFSQLFGIAVTTPINFTLTRWLVFRGVADPVS